MANLLILIYITICISISLILTKPKIDVNEIGNTVGYEVLEVIKRPLPVYTQGIFFSDDGKYLYESGGLYRTSTLKKLSYPDLKVAASSNLDKKYFAEGIAKCGETIYQLTWQENDILKYDADDLKKLGAISMDRALREGWGLSEYKDNYLIATDGSPNIFFLNCKNNLKSSKRITVTYNGIGLNNLNALVYAKNFIYSNRYFDSKIYKIDPETGIVIKTYEMDPLVQYELKKGILSEIGLRSGNVLNGITYHSQNDEFLITGKLWGFFYRVKFD